MLSLVTLTGEQQAAVEMVKNSPFTILTGGPGTGKTTTIRAVLDWADNEGLISCLCAPTGKAAKRILEATGRQASTIHRTLDAKMDKGCFYFGHNSGNKLGFDLLIVDEASMISGDLMASLLEAVDPQKTKVLIVGDTGQLPSVGPGAVLRDLLASPLPHVRLGSVHRNSGLIVKACHAISQGQDIFFAPKLDLEAGDNFRHIEVGTPEEIQRVVKIIAERMRDRGYNPVWDVQTISPVNSRGPLSCNSMNELLREEFNPPTGDGEGKFRPKDKVINTKNLSLKDVVSGQDTSIVNGDLGEVLAVEKQITVKFFDPERTVQLPKTSQLLFAYCITCHRMQGSETPVVVIPIHKTFQYILNRPWIYTAISRAKDICITVGQFSALKLAAKTVESVHNRKTFLVEKIFNLLDI